MRALLGERSPHHDSSKGVSRSATPVGIHLWLVSPLQGSW